MSKANPTTTLSRRSFLKYAAVAAGVAAAGPGIAAATTSAAPANALTISVLLPSSSLYPTIGASLVLGMRSYLQGAGGQIAGRPVRLLTAPLGNGPHAAEAALGNALGAQGADLVVGMSGPEYAPQLQPLLERRRAMLFAVDAGANVPRLGQQSPLVVHNSLGVWQSAYALGAWSAAHIGRRAALALSFYESGYDAPYAFRLGFEQAGGQVVFDAVSHNPTAPAQSLGALWQRLSAAEPDLVYASYSGPQALEFVRSYEAAGLAGQLPLLGTGFMLDGALLPSHAAAAAGAYSALAYDGQPWLDLGPRIAADSPRTLDSFAIMGYETAGLIAAGLAAAGGDARDTARMRAGLPDARLASPRGQLAIDPDTLAVSAAIQLRQVQQQAGALANRALASLPSVGQGDSSLAELRAAPRTGWLHSYLCI